MCDGDSGCTAGSADTPSNSGFRKPFLNLQLVPRLLPRKELSTRQIPFIIVLFEIFYV